MRHGGKLRAVIRKKREIKQIDEHAFVVEKDGLNIMGRFEKHL